MRKGGGEGKERNTHGHWNAGCGCAEVEEVTSMGVRGTEYTVHDNVQVHYKHTCACTLTQCKLQETDMCMYVYIYMHTYVCSDSWNEERMGERE